MPADPTRPARCWREFWFSGVVVLCMTITIALLLWSHLFLIRNVNRSIQERLEATNAHTARLEKLLAVGLKRQSLSVAIARQVGVPEAEIQRLVNLPAGVDPELLHDLGLPELKPE